MDKSASVPDQALVSDGAASHLHPSGFDPSRMAETKAVLGKMIESRSAWAANNQRTLALLQPEWDMFEKREGHNVYVARLYAEHTSALRKDLKELAALECALAVLCDSDTQPKAGDVEQAPLVSGAGLQGIAPTSPVSKDSNQ